MARVLVPLAEGCEELEAVTIIDLLRRAGIEVTAASLGNREVHCSRGVCLLADQTLDEVMNNDFDMIVLPGGLPGADHLDADPRIHQLLKKTAENGGYTAAICAAPKVLANAGLLENRKATSYPGFIDKMPLATTMVLQDPVVTDERIITSRGPGTAMDFALELIEKLLGREQRNAVEKPLMRPTQQD
jgi:4-methyl-5(b-hydroxyethyl)-thiazole monophosphate biosynthesis